MAGAMLSGGLRGFQECVSYEGDGLNEGSIKASLNKKGYVCGFEMERKITQSLGSRTLWDC
jgi:hypothetical protein